MHSFARPAASGFLYSAYGLTICSDFALPELAPSPPAEIDVRIVTGKVGPPVAEMALDAQFTYGPDRQTLSWRAAGRFAIEGAATVIVDAAPGVSDAVIRLPLLGPVFGLLLHLRGHLVLHASATARDGRAAVFLGDKGAGKSTTGAALVAAGHDLVSDDVVAITFHGAPRLLPSFPQMKLSPSAAAATSIDALTAPPELIPGLEKHQHRVPDRFGTAAVDLHRVYVLERGRRADLTRLDTSDALAALLRFSYLFRFDRAAASPESTVRHFRQCTQLAEAGLVHRLTMPDGLGRLGEGVDLIERDLGR